MLLIDQMKMTVDENSFHVEFGRDGDELIMIVYGWKRGWWSQIGELHTTDNFLTLLGHLEGLVRYMDEHA